MASASNSSSLLHLSHEAFMAVPRLLQNAGAFAFEYMPDQLDSFFARAGLPGSLIASKTPISNASTAIASANSATSDPVSSVFWQAFAGTQSAGATATSAAASAAGSAMANEGWWSSKTSVNFRVQDMGSLDGIFSYFASRWALSTFMIAIILNRARVYSASRRRLTLNWQTRLALRIVPILLFVHQLQVVLQMMRCQTGSMLPLSNPNGTTKVWNGHFTHEGGPLYHLSSVVLFRQTERDSCLAAGMLPLDDTPPLGSSSILWPMFLCLCLSHLIETISCALEGRHPVPETAMTLFEHSLAFAEAEAVVRSSVGLGLFGSLKGLNFTEANANFLHFTRSMVLQRLNVPPEVLSIALISSCSHLSNHMLGVLGLQSRFRLVNTTIWGVSFITAFIWSFVRFAASINGSDVGILRYPMICVIGFIPHILIIASILVCLGIYSLSLLVTILSPPTSESIQMSWKNRFWLAKDNLQASIAISNIHVRWSDEFYTTLLKVGYNVLTAASEAVYFNEGISIAVSRSTWLEEKRMEELALAYPLQSQLRLVTVPSEIEGALNVAEGLNLVDAVNELDISQRPTSGYAKERKTAKVSVHPGTAAIREDGVGGSQRSGRWYMSWTLVQQDCILLARLMAKVLVKALRKISPHMVSEQLVMFANPLEVRTQKPKERPQQPTRPLDFWVLSDDGSLHLPSNATLDVETETRKRLGQGSLATQYRNEADIDHYLYDWWKKGGMWGELDKSGAYRPSAQDNEDTTSIITESDAQSLLSYDSESDTAPGRRTPTQANPHPHRTSRESSLVPENMLSDLSRLLDPKTQEEKNEARLLSSRLSRDTILTRSQYKRQRNLENLRLVAGRAHKFDKDTLTPQEEEELFEKIILARREEASVRSQADGTYGQSWSEGGEGLGAGGPQCVVCQSSPRTILVWPCRCLCLCEECRVSLALNNFSNCVTCRRDVVAFSRLFVP